MYASTKIWLAEQRLLAGRGVWLLRTPIACCADELGKVSQYAIQQTNKLLLLRLLHLALHLAERGAGSALVFRCSAVEWLFEGKVRSHLWLQCRLMPNRLKPMRCLHHQVHSQKAQPKIWVLVQQMDLGIISLVGMQSLRNNAAMRTGYVLWKIVGACAGYVNGM